MIRLILVVSLWCNGLTFLSEEGEPLAGFRKSLRHLPLIISKPLLLCISCMASVHTAIVLVLWGWIFNCLSWTFMRQYILIAPACIFMNGFLFLLRGILEKIYFYVKKNLSDE